MRQMTVGHQVTIDSDLGDRVRLCPTVNSYAFPDSRPGTDVDITDSILEDNVLGQIAKENRMTAGLGVPVAGEDATLDLSVQRANRTLSGSGLKESAWLLGIGLQIRPRN